MKLYPIPGGIWAGTEADWKKALKARGLDPKNFRTADGKPLQRDVGTSKGDLLEFLNFFAVDVFRTGDEGNIVVAGQVDPDELQRRHNADAPDLPAATEPQPGETTADVQLSRMENPGTDIDAVVEFVCNLKGYALKRVAGAVAGAFAALAA